MGCPSGADIHPLQMSGIHESYRKKLVQTNRWTGWIAPTSNTLDLDCYNFTYLIVNGTSGAVA